MIKMFKIGLDIYDLGTVNETVLKQILTPCEDGECRYNYNGETYCFSPEELYVEEMSMKILVKTIEYCSEGSCCSSYHSVILGIVNDITKLDSLIEQDVTSHKYIKYAKNKWWNGLDYGWEYYSYKLEDIPVLN